MDSFKEFQGKSLDEAISEACSYFDAPREKLEIDIVQDSKSGIFGLVGARKAKVRARRVQLRNAVEDILGRKGSLREEATEPKPAAEKARSESSGEKKPETRPAAAPERAERPERADRPERTERTDRPDRTDRADRFEKTEKSERSDKAEKNARSPERHAERQSEKHGERHGGRSDRHGARGEKPRQHEVDDETVSSADSGQDAASARTERSDRSDEGREGRERGRARLRGTPRVAGRRPERAERPERGERAERPERGERSGEERRRAPRPAPQSAPGGSPADVFGEDQDDGDNLQRIPFEELDQDRLRSLSLEVVAKLVSPIVGDLPLSVDLQDGRVNVRMDCGDDSGLLIGREGQTLASLQYLASRMVSRGMSAAVRVQLDAGEYRLRQDEKLREMALALAEKVRATGKSHSTRPLSSYHRRIVHLVLQEATDVQTRSSGDGPLKRVVIQRKRA